MGKDKRKVLIGYKAVSINHGGPWSWCRDQPYAVGQWTLRRKKYYGPLSVFKTLKTAKAFFKKWSYGTAPGSVAIYRCAYIRSLPNHRTYWTTLPGPFSITYRPAEPLPPGKDFADAVCLLEKVWPKGGVK
jgi:hypothetical protein